MFTVPIIGSAVWIEFEQGDPDYPIWTGCFTAAPRKVPPMAERSAGRSGITLQTPLQNSLTISDVHRPDRRHLLIKTIGERTIHFQRK